MEALTPNVFLFEDRAFKKFLIKVKSQGCTLMHKDWNCYKKKTHKCSLALSLGVDGTEKKAT